MTRPANHVYEFGEFRLETAERLLLRAGTPIHLTPKAFETLVVLVENGGRLVKKDDLMREIWPDVVVEEANLARNIWTLRRALGDHNGEPRYIETTPKLGYRFVAPVTEVAADRAPVTLEAIIGPAVDVQAVSKPSDERRPPVSRNRAFPTAVLTAGLISLVVLSAAVARSWHVPSPAESVPSITFLTDGRQADLGAYWTDDSRIYFSRFVTSTRVETWTMNSDGSGQHRANAAIESLVAGRWSPDGRRVFFRREVDPSTAYLADDDGRNEVPLPLMSGNMDWSPDGSQIVYEARNTAGASEVFLYTVATGARVSLTPGIASADPSFSYDGKQIAFTSWRDGNAEIYVMNADGSGVRRLTNHPAFDNYPVFSPDGTYLAFQSNREDEHVEIYLQALHSNAPPIRLTRSTGLTGLFPKCWSPDGTRMLVYTERNGTSQIAVINVEPVSARLVLSDPAADLGTPRLSADGKRLLHEARLTDRSLELRVFDLETRRSRTVFKTTPGYPGQFRLEPAWSRDNSVIAFCDKDAGNTEIFTIRTDGTGLRNVSQNPLLDSSPVFSPEGEIVFARDSYGQAKLYRMDMGGGNQRRVTDAAGYEMTPSFSPDGTRLVFAADRTSRGLDIVLLDLNAPRRERLVAGRRFHDSFPAYSRDGSRIAFVANSDGNPEIYVMNSDGTGLSRRTYTRQEEAAPFFVRDGNFVLFSSNRTGKFALYQIPAR